MYLNSKLIVSLALARGEKDTEESQIIREGRESGRGEAQESTEREVRKRGRRERQE